MSDQPSDDLGDRDERNFEDEDTFSPAAPPAAPPSNDEGRTFEEELEETPPDNPRAEAEPAEIKTKEQVIVETMEGFLRKHLFDAVLLVIVLISLIGIIFLSRDLADPEEFNPNEIIGYDTNTHIMIFVLSIIAFWLILIVFSRMLFSNRGKEFGIEDWSLFRKIVFFLITLTFVSSVYMLLDVAVINAFLLHSSMTALWDVRNEFLTDTTILSEIPTTTDKAAYAQIRAITFTLFYIILLVFPVTMFLVILTRRGRARLLSPKMGTRKYQILKKAFKYITYAFLIVGVIFGVSIMVALHLPWIAILFIISSLFMGLVVIGLLFLISYLALRAFDVAKWMVMSNILIIAPIIAIFFLFPVFVWTVWDIYLILDTGTLADTIYALEDVSFVKATAPADYDYQNLADLELGEQIAFFANTFYFNLFAYQRILMMDFVIIVGFAALIIGIAEGYSIVAIFQAMFKGVSVARTGQIVQESPPAMVVIATRLALLAAWLMLVWDNFLTIWRDLLPRFGMDLPDIEAPAVLEVLQELAEAILDVDVLVPLGLLIIPLYFIVGSSLKFFSVTIVSERVKHDANLVFLLTTSAYVLIVTAIFGDVAALEEFKPGGEYNQYLPLSNTPLMPLLPDIIDIIEMILAVSFYLGLIIAILYFMRYVINKVRKKDIAAA
ncbi:MAG: hypothetical protein ACFFGZ_16585 [Candidatus Thorarchaeota archaeon]